ncbi:MAG: pseudouridine synthase [Terrimonas sp.]|nr:pseudouridine synthase [Terrimonas sp.]OJY87747.1 MAG: pseudouridine synthase [Sphingobacteriales bacterium 40-81]
MHHSYYIIYKPYMVLSQFTSVDGKQCLKDLFSPGRDVYPVGRLDYDSEGLLILTNDAALNHKLLNPLFKHQRKYMVQVDGQITTEALVKLQGGIDININGKTYRTQSCEATLINGAPLIPDRNPPVRYRKNIPTSWIELTLTEGKNRQVRKMTAAVGFPTLRLIRSAIGNITIGDLQPGDIKALSGNTIYRQLFGK